MIENWIGRALELGAQARRRRYEQGRALGSRWMLECRDMWDSEDDDGGVYFQLCSDYAQALAALPLILNHPQEVRLLGIYDLHVDLESQGGGWSVEEFRRRGRSLAMQAQGQETLLRPDRGLALLCDSITADPQAAQWALEKLPDDLCLQLDHLPPDQVAETVANLLSETSQQIWHRGQRERLLDGVGAAVVVAYVRGLEEGESPDFQYFISWAGDARAYLWSDGQLKRLTQDHVDPQMPTARPLVQYLGIGDLRPQSVRGQMAPAARILLCNQALTSLLSEDEIAAFFFSPSWGETCQALQAAAHNKAVGSRKPAVNLALLGG